MTELRWPHERLAGVQLENGWTVKDMVGKVEGHTGGHFSCGYTVEKNDQTRGYLKALDLFSPLQNSDDPARDLQPLLQAFNFERDLLSRCAEKRLRRVVRAIESGRAHVDKTVVQYIIFELADGDVRSVLALDQPVRIAWALRSLHQTAAALVELHSIAVAHQDLKPSNVLLFNDGTLSKLGDLGRAAWRGREAPHEAIECAGDLTYAPPERLYGAGAEDWQSRRYGCDAYLLGSMIVSLFTGVSMTSLLRLNLPETVVWSNWTGTYEEALPYVEAAFADSVDYVQSEIPDEIRGKLVQMIRELCNPQPERRGHPKETRATAYSLRRYVSQLDVIAKRAEYSISGVI